VRTTLDYRSQTISSIYNNRSEAYEGCLAEPLEACEGCLAQPLEAFEGRLAEPLERLLGQPKLLLLGLQGETARYGEVGRSLLLQQKTSNQSDTLQTSS
jgi:hypothetical protein